MNIKYLTNKINKGILTFQLGCLAGSIIFLLIYGTSVLSFSNTEWLMASNQLEGLWDLTQHYMGWVFYRNSPWHFPFGLLDGLYMSPVSVTYTDSIPLFAIFFKVLSPILPEQFQYFGLFGIISYALTGGFGALLIRRFTDSLPFQLLCGIFFTLSPVLTKRMFYHTALAAPFLILAAFCLCAYASALPGKKRILCWCLLSSFSLLINPYYVPMVLGVLLCELLYELLHKEEICFLLLSFLAPVCSLLLAGYLSGMFYGSVSASANGLTDLSFNLLQFVNPLNEQLRIEHRTYLWSDQSYSNLLPALPLTSPWQVEGFSYLGLGMIVLLAVAILLTLFYIYRLRKIRSNEKKEANIDLPGIFCIILCFIVFTFLALSPTATILEHTLYQIAYPDWIYKILSVFRSTGRLIWPVYYGVMSIGFIGLARLFPKRTGRKASGKFYVASHLPVPFTVFFLLLQIYDLSPALIEKHRLYTDTVPNITYESPLASEAWDVLGRNSGQIIFYPPTHYGLYCDPYVSCTFVAYANAYDLSCNITYLSRNLSLEADQATHAHFEQRKAGDAFPENIYVFFDISEVPPASQTDLHYYEIDGFIIGTDLDLSESETVIHSDSDELQ